MASSKAQAWTLYDAIVAEAALRDVSPWTRDGDTVQFVPDETTLVDLLRVPLWLGASSQSGVPALALDVWVSYELRRAGFDTDAVWPRPTAPRVLPHDVALLVASLPVRLRDQVSDRMRRGLSGGATPSGANLLGRNYVKQVDVVMSTWQSGPQLMVSTKRMDYSFAKNAPNRVEESYGDAKNLGGRHPHAALGFLYSLRSNAFAEDRATADWLVDQLVKLGRADDAYDACCLIVPEYDEPAATDDTTDAEPEEITPAMPLDAPDDPEAVGDADQDVVEEFQRSEGPFLRLRPELVPPELSPARFFEVLVAQVLDSAPVNLHTEARDLRSQGQTGEQRSP